MLLTTNFVTMVMLTVWNIPAAIAFTFYTVFFMIEAVYFSSVLVKIPTGMPAVLSLHFADIMQANLETSVQSYRACLV